MEEELGKTGVGKIVSGNFDWNNSIKWAKSPMKYEMIKEMPPKEVYWEPEPSVVSISKFNKQMKLVEKYLNESFTEKIQTLGDTAKTVSMQLEFKEVDPEALKLLYGNTPKFSEVNMQMDFKEVAPEEEEVFIPGVNCVF